MNLATTFIIGSFSFKKINDMINKQRPKNTIDDLIEKKIKENKKGNKDYVLGKFKSTRKIPDKQELKKMYDKFIKNNNIIQNNELNKRIIFNHIIKECTLKNDNTFLMYDLNLQPTKNYRIYLSFIIHESQNITFLFQKYKNIYFTINNEKNNNRITFITNIISKDYYNEYSHSQLYILFDKYKKNIKLKDVFFEIKEIENEIIFPMTLIKNNEIQYIY
jgi:hypothetical protein